ncbi:MAG: hypothetical protein P4N59_07730, partial [Negativicutes bacterium]|nr:hypothetical protein [Negativicutes bacterium]
TGGPRQEVTPIWATKPARRPEYAGRCSMSVYGCTGGLAALQPKQISVARSNSAGLFAVRA